MRSWLMQLYVLTAILCFKAVFWSAKVRRPRFHRVRTRCGHKLLICLGNGAGCFGDQIPVGGSLASSPVGRRPPRECLILFSQECIPRAKSAAKILIYLISPQGGTLPHLSTLAGTSQGQRATVMRLHVILCLLVSSSATRPAHSFRLLYAISIIFARDCLLFSNQIMETDGMGELRSESLVFVRRRA